MKIQVNIHSTWKKEKLNIMHMYDRIKKAHSGNIFNTTATPTLLLPIFTFHGHQRRNKSTCSWYEPSLYGYDDFITTLNMYELI